MEENTCTATLSHCECCIVHTISEIHVCSCGGSWKGSDEGGDLEIISYPGTSGSYLDPVVWYMDSAMFYRMWKH